MLFALYRLDRVTEGSTSLAEADGPRRANRGRLDAASIMAAASESAPAFGKVHRLERSRLLIQTLLHSGIRLMHGHDVRQMPHTRFSRIVITHAADTMTRRVRALGGIVGKTMVLAGAVQP